MKALPLSFLVTAVLLGHADADDLGLLFTRLDANHDGEISKGEILPENATLFERLLRNADRDDNGRMSVEEFLAGLTPARPEKPLTEKADSELPGSNALLLMLAWMDGDTNLTIDQDEVPARLQPLFGQFVELMNEDNQTRIRVPQLRQQSIRYAGLSARFAFQLGIDVEVELALLNDVQWDYVQRLKTSLRPASGMASPENAAVLFAELDTNGDGKVSADEVPEPFAERFARLLERGDRDQDKQLSEREFQLFSRRLTAMPSTRSPLAETTQRARQLLRRSDRNGDGRLSGDEAPPRLAQRFDRVDENGDGLLDIDELTRAAENLATLRNSAGNRSTAKSRVDERGNNSGKK